MLGDIGLGILQGEMQSSRVQPSYKQVFTVQTAAQIHRWLRKEFPNAPEWVGPKNTDTL